MIFLTTTAIDIDEELLNRCLVLSVDEAREQTRAIHRLQRERRTLEGLLAGKRREAIVALHQNAQRLLRPLAVVNPYAPELTFLDTQIRTRRDHEKYLTLIDAIALLHQHQRPVKRASVDGRPVEYVEVELGDIETANRLAHEVLGRSLDELPPQTRRLLALLDELVVGRVRAARRWSAATSASPGGRCARRPAGATRSSGSTWRGWWSWSTCWCTRAAGGRATSTSCSTRRGGDEERPLLPGLIDVEALRAREAGVRREERGGSEPPRRAEPRVRGAIAPPTCPHSRGDRGGELSPLAAETSAENPPASPETAHREAGEERRVAS